MEICRGCLKEFERKTAKTPYCPQCQKQNAVRLLRGLLLTPEDQLEPVEDESDTH